jgi:Transposase
VAECLEATLPEECARARLDADRARRQASDDGKQILAPHAPLERASAFRVRAVELEYVLRQVDPERLDGHRSSLLCSDDPASPVGGRAVHPITWRKRYAGMEASEAKRLRELEAENTKLKRIVADQMLDMSAMKDLLEKRW